MYISRRFPGGLPDIWLSICVLIIRTAAANNHKNVNRRACLCKVWHKIENTHPTAENFKSQAFEMYQRLAFYRQMYNPISILLYNIHVYSGSDGLRTEAHVDSQCETSAAAIAASFLCASQMAM